VTTKGIIDAQRPFIATLTGFRTVAAALLVFEHFAQTQFATAPGLAPLRRWIVFGYHGVRLRDNRRFRAAS